MQFYSYFRKRKKTKKKLIVYALLRKKPLPRCLLEKKQKM